MRLPDSFLDELRTRLSLSQVVGRKVVWDMRKSNQAKGDWWAPCPFHQEKTASFHVDDRKGFYYCFGCQAKGNLFGFVQESENVGFLEAVEILAREAGMPMPARDPKAAERADRNAQLIELCEAAAKWFRTQLRGARGSDARDYLRGRRLAPETLDRFEIGFAPGERIGLIQHLRGKGAPDALIEAAGLSTPADEGDVRDRFLNRITFPIRDGRGRCIAFGGRAMNPNAKAKYLNSPETAIFDKGATLYNLGPARTAAGKGQPLVVAEGYMDVIALAQAGLEAAVAPLGTAVTERQLQVLWRVTPEPVVALDGDAAGQRAGLRVADLALPMLRAGQGLRFAPLPEGQDPDDVIRAGGADAMRRVLETAQPMVDLLWQRAVAGKVLDSPERRAALDEELRALVRRIEDAGLRRHYGAEFARRRTDLFGPEMPAPRAASGTAAQDGRGPRGPHAARGGRWAPPAQPSPTARGSALATGSAPEAMLEQVVLAGMILHPGLVEAFAFALEETAWSDPMHGRLAALLLDVDPVAPPETILDGLRGELGAPALDRLLGAAHVRISPAGRPDGDIETAADCVRDTLRRLEARRGAEAERAEAMEDFAEGGDESLTWRISQATRRRDATMKVNFDAMSADAEQDEANAAFLQGLLDTLDEAKKRSK